MSTIEEAREQARKLDEPLRQAGNRVAYYRTGELELIEATRRTLRALLDATEPPANVTDLPKSDIPAGQMSARDETTREELPVRTRQAVQVP